MGAESVGDDRWRALLAGQLRDNHRLFFKLAYGVLRDAAAAEDACQHALCQAWEHRGRIEDPAALTGWLSRTVVNRALEIARRRTTERRALDARTDPHPTGTAVGEGVAMRESIVLALDELPEMTRVVVVMRVMRGDSGNDVAATLGLSASEVSRRLHAGMEQLRRSLRDWRASVGA